MTQEKLSDIGKEIKKRGFPDSGAAQWFYDEKEDRLTVIGERRQLIAYEKGVFFSVTEAKQNACRLL